MIVRQYTHQPATRAPVGAMPHVNLVHAVETLPDSVTLPDRIYDQGSAGTCWGFGYGKAAECFQLANGLPAEPVSALAACTLGRMLMAANPDVPLTDSGTDPAIGVEALARFGVLPEVAYPYTDQPPRLNARLGMAELEEAAIAKVDGFSWITEVGDALVRAIQLSLAAKIPVAFGMDVDDAYEGLGAGQVYDGPKGPLKGGHAQRFSGYGPDYLIVTGSWGAGFADGGYARVSYDFVRNGGIWDVAALRWSPTLRT